MKSEICAYNYIFFGRGVKTKSPKNHNANLFQCSQVTQLTKGSCRPIILYGQLSDPLNDIIRCFMVEFLQHF